MACDQRQQRCAGQGMETCGTATIWGRGWSARPRINNAEEIVNPPSAPWTNSRLLASEEGRQQKVTGGADSPATM